jgi:hypothetical protein
MTTTSEAENKWKTLETDSLCADQGLEDSEWRASIADVQMEQQRRRIISAPCWILLPFDASTQCQ